MSDLEYPACINELYQSEVPGEKAFLAAPDPVEKRAGSIQAVRSTCIAHIQHVLLQYPLRSRTVWCLPGSQRAGCRGTRVTQGAHEVVEGFQV